MADIGRSTASHVSRQELNYPDGHEALDNWAAWYREADYGMSTSTVQPMFREVKSGYREASQLRTQYDEDYALLIDRLMAKLLKKRELNIVFCRYVDVMNSSAAVRHLKHIEKEPIKVAEYELRLESVVARVDMALNIADQQLLNRG